jgi:diadenylate cyclase
VVVIVSEQTGSISVAVDGMLKRHLDKDTFEKLLTNELIIGDATGLSKKKTRDRKVKEQP